MYQIHSLFHGTQRLRVLVLGTLTLCAGMAAAATFDELSQRLAAPGLSAAEIATLRTQAADALATEGRLDKAVEFCIGIVRDDAAPLDSRLALGRKAAGWRRSQLKRPAEAVDLLEELLKLPLDGAQSAAVQFDMFLLAMHNIQPRNLDKIEELGLAVIGNADAPVWQRVNTTADLLNAFYGERDPLQKARPLAVADKVLADESLPVNSTIRIRELLQRTLTALGRAEEAAVQTKTIMATTNAPAASRVAACAFLAEPMIAESRYEEAEKFYRQAFDFAGHNPQTIATVVGNIGRLYLVQDKLDAALSIYREGYKHFNNSDMTNRVTELAATALADALRFEDAANLWLAAGNPLKAADVYAGKFSSLGEKGRELRLKVLADEKATAADRRAAYAHFLGHDNRDVEVAIRYVDVFVRDNTNGAIRTFTDKITRGGSGTAYFGDFAGSLRYLEWLKPLAAPNVAFKTTVCGINAYAGLGRLDDAVAFAREALGYNGYSAGELYQLRMTIAALGLRDTKATSDSLASALARADAAAVEELPATSAERAAALEGVGAVALQAGLEPAARAVAAFYRGLYVAQPRKRYTVTYSPTPISGLTAWDAVAGKVESQEMDRKYGGNTDFLTTDVGTGNRGAGIGSGGKTDLVKYTRMSAVCDVNGIHFRFDGTDDKARVVEARLAGAGSYEGYIAPGANQPYICFLVDLQTGKIDFYNTTYETRQHKRITNENLTLWRGEHRFTDTGYSTYLFLSWEAYADKLPEGGDLWDFENVHWGRDGNFAWNGLESIHGRSSWGNLAFAIPDEGLKAIKRKLIYSALASYKSEKRTSHHHEGVIDHWSDASVGDPAFHDACVRPLVEKLDAFIPLVREDMPDADVERVFNEAVEGWNNIGHIIADMRRKYLAEILTR